MYKDLTAELRIFETVCKHSDKPDIADLARRAADALEELSKKRKPGEWCADYDYAEYDFDGSTPLPEPRKFQDGWQCSLCGGYSPSETNFCSNCGAKMSGGDEDV